MMDNHFASHGNDKENTEPLHVNLKDVHRNTKMDSSERRRERPAYTMRAPLADITRVRKSHQVGEDKEKRGGDKQRKKKSLHEKGLHVQPFIFILVSKCRPWSMGTM